MILKIIGISGTMIFTGINIADALIPKCISGKVMDIIFGEEEDFDYVSTTAPSRLP